MLNECRINGILNWKIAGSFRHILFKFKWKGTKIQRICLYVLFFFFWLLSHTQMFYSAYLQTWSKTLPQLALAVHALWASHVRASFSQKGG